MSDSSKDTLTKEVIYSELKNDIRHFSNLRFAMITIFMTATASLLLAYYYTPTSSNTVIPKHYIVYGGTWVTLVFGVLEVMLSYYLNALQASLRQILGDQFSFLYAHRKSVVNWIIRCSFLSLYLSMMIYWMSEMCGLGRG